MAIRTESRTQTIFPALKYEDAGAAIAWLERALGCETLASHEAPDGKVAHAELSLEGEVIMLGSVGAGDSGFDIAAGHSSTYVVVDDPDARYERARAAGAEIYRELRDEDYGSRGFTARDPEGNMWSFGTYRPTVS